MNDATAAEQTWTPQRLMQAAIEKAEDGMRNGQSPFGCAIAVDNKLIACEHNTVVASPDATAHAEVNAIRTACAQLQSHHLVGAVVATTCEPCPMCMAALHWARVSEVHFGATIADATAAGFNELNVSAADLLRQGGSDVELRPALMAAACRELFRQWIEDSQRRAY